MYRKFLLLPVCACLLLTFVHDSIQAQEPDTDVSALQMMSRRLEARDAARRSPEFLELFNRNTPARIAQRNNPDLQLMYIDELGHPAYYITNNLTAARTLNVETLWSAPWNLTGTGLAAGRLRIWDAGAVRTTHQEFGGRVVQMDSPASTHYHSTHCAGTLVASGAVGNAKGMANQGLLRAYDWTNDESEMASAAALGTVISSHSYGFGRGWSYNSTDSNWYWYGNPAVSETEDYKFGLYDTGAREWDQIAYSAPHYLIFKSAGNDRNDYGPGAGGGHYVYSGGWVWSTTTRDADGGADGYDSIGTRGSCKNLMVIGSVADIPGGYSQPSDVAVSSFSGWGPSDDGRIRPDLVANGEGLYSTYDTSDSAYNSISGTSMACPNAAGAAALVAEHYDNVIGGMPRSATLKALLINSADEAGTADGPDYRHGWGLLNAERAVETIDDGMVIEGGLSDGEVDDYIFAPEAGVAVSITLAWTDPAGTAQTGLNSTVSNLVNDLDIRAENDSGEHLPWILDPASPSSIATRGDNFRDNVEFIRIASHSGEPVTVRVSHKGTLSSNQAYSLVINRVSTSPVCWVSTDELSFPFTTTNDVLTQDFEIRNIGGGLLEGTIVESNRYCTLSHETFALNAGEGLVVTVTASSDYQGGCAEYWDISLSSPCSHTISCVARVEECVPMWFYCNDIRGSYTTETLPDTLYVEANEYPSSSTLVEFYNQNCCVYPISWSLTQSDAWFAVDEFGNGSIYPFDEWPIRLFYNGTDSQARYASFHVDVGYEVFDFVIAGVCTPCVDEKTWHVATSGDNGNPGTSAEPFRDIQYAVDYAASSGDTIMIHDGPYLEHVAVSSALTFRSASGDTAACILEAPPGYRVMTITDSPDTVRIEGLTLTGGTPAQGDYSGYDLGGGLLVVNTPIVVNNCRIRDNTVPADQTDSSGGAVHVRDGSYLRMVGCMVDGNSSPKCAGVMIRGEAGADLYANLIVNNHANSHASGLWVLPDLAATTPYRLVGNTIAANTLAIVNGFGVRLNSLPNLELEKNIIALNSGGEAQIGFLDLNDPTLDCNVVYPGPEYFASNSVYDAGADIHADPRFCGPANLDFMLDETSPAAAANSPCGLIGVLDVGCALSGVGGDDVVDLPTYYALHQAYPNPFNPQTTIAFDLPQQVTVRLTVYDVGGRVVRTLIAGDAMPAGRHASVWNGRDASGQAAAAGVYFYRLEAGERTMVKRVVMIK
jgi:Subtilase family/FlgD Ig-like domain